MTKYRLACFPMHPPLQHNLFKTGHEFHIIEGVMDVYWSDRKNPVIGSAARPLPDNAKLITLEEWEENKEKYDGLMLQTPEHMRSFGRERNAIFTWHQIVPIPVDILGRIFGRPIGIETSTNMELRKQDRLLTCGFDPKEYSRRDWNEPHEHTLLFPINNFQFHGHVMGGNLTGYLWKDAIKELYPYVEVCGYNPKYDGSYSRYDWDSYKNRMSKVAGVLQPSPVKHRSLVTGDAMATGQAIVTRPSVPFKHNPSLLQDGFNAQFITTSKQLIDLVRGKFMGDRKFHKFIGENALQTLYDKWHISHMIAAWNDYFDYVIGDWI